jgi:hypothetical protein
MKYIMGRPVTGAKGKERFDKLSDLRGKVTKLFQYL